MIDVLMIEAPPSSNPKDCEVNLSYTSIRLLLILCIIFSYLYFWWTPMTKYFTGFFCILLINFLRFPEVTGGEIKGERFIIKFWKTISHAFIFTFVQVNQKWKVVTKNKMDKSIFIDEETIPLVHQDEDYNDYNTPNTSKVYETSFTELDTTEAKSTLQLRTTVKRDKITALYRHLNVVIQTLQTWSIYD